jgi:hypothetical protein
MVRRRLGRKIYTMLFVVGLRMVLALISTVLVVVLRIVLSDGDFILKSINKERILSRFMTRKGKGAIE